MVTLKTPALPEHAAHASLLRWTTRRGQSVRKGQVLALLEVDDQLLAIESPADGVVQALHARKLSPLVAGDALLDLDPEGRASLAPETPQETAMPQTPSSNLPEGNDRVTALLLPQVGNSMEEGTILKWHVQEGDQIEIGQVLYEVETDKATVEIEAEQTGRLSRIVVQEDQTAPVKTPVAYLADKDEDVEALLSQAQPSQENEPSVEAPQASTQPGPEGEVIPILMPQVGNSMEEGTIVKWHVRLGDRVEKGQVLFEVETDKAVVEVESDNAGRLARIVLDEGQTLAVKQPVAYLADNDQDVDAYLSTSGAQAAFEEVAPKRDTSPPVQEEVQVPAKAAPKASQGRSGGQSSRVKASPAARKLAAKRSIDLSSLPAGSGPGGRILTGDLPQGQGAAAFHAPQPVRLGETTREPLTRMRRAIGNALQASKQNIPHFYMRLSVDAQGLMSFYRRSKEQFQLSLNDVITASCGLALGEFPAFRSRIEQDELVTAGTVNIGIAVGLEQGLVVPVVQGIESLSLKDLAARTREVVQSARNGKIEGMGTGAFTISNLGMFGVEEFSAIINPPESAILAVGAAREEVIVENGAMRPGRKMTLTLSCDHRVVDGVVAAKFCARLKEILQAPQDYIR